MEPFAN